MTKLCMCILIRLIVFNLVHYINAYSQTSFFRSEIMQCHFKPRSARRNENQWISTLAYSHILLLDMHHPNWWNTAASIALVASLVFASHMPDLSVGGRTTSTHRRGLSGKSQGLSCKTCLHIGCGTAQVIIYFDYSSCFVFKKIYFNFRKLLQQMGEEVDEKKLQLPVHISSAHFKGTLKKK